MRALCFRAPSVAAALFLCLAAAQQAQPAVPAVSAGGVHTVALGADGFVRTWGDDSAGELGTGRTIDATVAQRVSSIVPAGTATIAAGAYRGFAITAAGVVYGWGGNYSGELGNGATSFAEPAPSVVIDLPAARFIAAGGSHTVGVMLDGRVYAWGANRSGQLGDGTNADRPRPLPVAGLQSVSAVAAGDGHSLAVKSDGSVWSWGYNGYGQLGDGTKTDRSTPVPVVGLDGVTAVCAAYAHSLALRNDGSVWAWGWNDYGQLGDAGAARSSASRVGGLPPVAAIACSSLHNVVLARDGTVWTWGGDIASATPVVVPGLIARSVAAGTSHFLAVKSDGSVWAWGSNNKGQLGDGTFTNRTSPVRAQIACNAVEVAGGSMHSLARCADGTVWAWGNNWEGQLGDGIAELQTVPYVVRSLDRVTAVSAGYGHTVALRSDGTVWAWGNNGAGQCGDGSTVDRSTPVQVVGISSARAISSGWGHVLAALADGSVVAWGINDSGQAGPGAGTNVLRATLVPGVSNVVQVAAGTRFSLALKGDGTVWSWGANGSGELGDGTTDARLSPVQVSGLADIVAISAGYNHAAALARDGSVWTWGDNFYGELGDGSRTQRSVPVRVQGLDPMSSVSAGYTHTVALARDGSVWTWGSNASGQGDGTNGDHVIAVRLPEPDSAIAVSAGSQQNFYGSAHTAAITRDGVMWTWGDNFFGQLGDGTLVNRRSPVIVLRESGAGSLANGDWYLDLDAGVANNVPASKAPVFLARTSSVGSTVAATVQPRPQDIGTSANVYVFALAPVALVKGAAELKAAEKAAGRGYLEWKSTSKDNLPVQCVLAQLTADGQLQAVSASTLQAFVTATLGSQGVAVTLINGVPTVNIAGATFFVGYGSSGQSMLDTGTHRGAATVPGSQLCEPQAPQTGWWWNPLEDGRGFSVEKHGNNIFFASFLYDVSGRSTWYVSSGPASLEGSLYVGDLLAASHGQTLDGEYFGRPNLDKIGTVTLTFNSATNGTLIWPGGTVPIQRQAFVPDGLSLPAMSNGLESGWWWNESEAGRGFFMEFQGNWLDVAGYMYDDQGNSVWYLTVAQMSGTNQQSFAGNWWSFGNGQTLTGPWRHNTQTSNNVAPVTITFTGTDNAVMTLPNGLTTNLKRHRF